jgi:hypothetical protein
MLAVSTAWAGEEGWQCADVTVAMSVTMDKATVPDPPVDSSDLGGAVHVAPMKPVLKAPGCMLLKFRYNRLLSYFAFHFGSRRYAWANHWRRDCFERT